MRFYSWASKTASSLNYGSDASFATPPKFTGVENPKLSQIDCLTPRAVDYPRKGQFLDRRQELNGTGQRPSRSTKPGVKASYHHIRNPGQSTSLPGISQVPLGSRGQELCYVQPTEPVKFPSISQISCLGGKTSPKERYSTRRFRTSDTDSEFVKVSKAGGHRGLLEYVEHSRSILNATPRRDGLNAPTALRSNVNMDLSSDVDPGWKPSSWAAISDRKQRIRQGDN